MNRKTQRGFTLIELLIVVAIIGIIAAIAIPNLLAAINRGRQKRTMADMRSVGTAAELYAVDHGYVPKNITEGEISGTILPTHLEPTYIKILPKQDGWNVGIRFASASEGDVYTIISYGADGAVEACTPGTQTKNFDCDICFVNGQFIQWPEGVQSK
jgi:general secretion pathway protein G